MKKRVVEFVARIKDGGAESLIKDYALLIDRNKFEVIILCCDYVKDSAIYKTLKENNIPIVSMYENHRFISRVLYRTIGTKYISLLLKKYILSLKPDVLHIHLEVLRWFSKIADSLQDIKLFYTCHNLPELFVGKSLVSENIACKYLIEHNNLRLIALHEDMAKELNNMFKISNTAVIRNAINFNNFRIDRVNKTAIRNKLNIPENAYVLGHIGRFSYQKNQEFLIDILKEAFNINKDSFLLLIGEGKTKGSIIKKIRKNKLSDKVVILSNRKDIAELLSIMDVFVFPSRFEGLGIVLIEAQLMNVNCIVSEHVPSEAFQSDLITQISLRESAKTWAENCLNPSSNIDSYGDISNYDMNKEIKKLEQLYSES